MSTFVRRSEGKVIPDALVQYSKGAKMRVDYEGAPGGIFWDGSKWVALVPELKKYMIIPDIVGRGESISGGAPIGKKSQAVSLGKSSIVAGIKCELWHVKGLGLDGKPAEADVCLAKNAGFMVGRMTLNEQGRQFIGFGLAYDKSLESGMGVLSVAVHGNTLYELTKVRAASVPDSLFVIPAGYKSMLEEGS